MSESNQPVWRQRMSAEPDAAALAYTSGRDVKALAAADAALAPFDIWTNRAHVAMLADQGIVSDSDAAKIGEALTELEGLVEKGEFQLDPQLEDVHMNVERYVADWAGAQVAGLMHTARSRNDQALTDLRLFLRQAELDLAKSTLELAIALQRRALSDSQLPMAGMSHTQPAAVTSLGHLWAAHAHALERDLDAFRALERFCDQSPLGAAAGFGTTWPVDRAKAADYLGFESLQINSLDCVSSRGELETRLASAVASLMSHLSVLAQDIIVLSSPPRRYITLSDAFVTGSSIMPQKRNPDFCEVTRAKAALAHGMLISLLGVGRGAISGYNRDHQWTKFMILDLIGETCGAPGIFADAIDSLSVDGEKMAQDARADFLNAVEVADFLAQERAIPFRVAHGLVAEACRESKTGFIDRNAMNKLLRRQGISPDIEEAEWATVEDPLLVLKRRQSAGSPNPDRLAEEIAPLSQRLLDESKRLNLRREKLDAARQLGALRLARSG